MTETEALDAMFAEAPNDWWRFVPCAMCNAVRGLRCIRWDDSDRPHATRKRAGLALHATLWLLRNFPGDLVNPTAAHDAQLAKARDAERVAREGVS